MSEYSSEYEFPATPTDINTFDWINILQSSTMAPEDNQFDQLNSSISFNNEKFEQQNSKIDLLDSLLADLDCRPLICRTAFLDDAMYGLSSDGYNIPSNYNVPTCVNPSQIHSPSPSQVVHENQIYSNPGSALSSHVDSHHLGFVPVPPLAADDIYSEIRRRTSDETLNQYGARISKEASLSAKLSPHLPVEQISYPSTPKKQPTLRRKKAQIFNSRPLEVSIPAETDGNRIKRQHSPLQNKQQIQLSSSMNHQSAVFPSPAHSCDDNFNSFFPIQMPPLTPSSAANVSFSSPHTPINHFNSSPFLPTTPKSAGQTSNVGSQYYIPALVAPLSKNDSTSLQFSIPSPCSPSRKVKSLPKRATSPAMPLLSFVNYTCADAEKLSAAVAPSGNGKRKAQMVVEQKQSNKKSKQSEY